MKKLTFLTIAALALSFASCKKARTCTCTGTTTYTQTHTNGDPSISGSGSGTDAWISTTKLSKKAAKGTCASGKTVQTDVVTTTGDVETTTYTTDQSCTLK